MAQTIARLLLFSKQPREVLFHPPVCNSTPAVAWGVPAADVGDEGGGIAGWRGGATLGPDGGGPGGGLGPKGIPGMGMPGAPGGIGGPPGIPNPAPYMGSKLCAMSCVHHPADQGRCSSDSLSLQHS